MSQGEVQLYSPGLMGGAPFAKDANGNTITLTGTQTSGMQEAIDCAWANGWNLRRFGNSGAGGTGIDFTYTAGVLLTGNPSGVKTTFSMHSGDATDYFGPEVPICWMVDTCAFVNIDRIAKTVMTNPAGVAVDFNPASLSAGIDPAQPCRVIGVVNFNLGFIMGPSGQNTATGVRLRSTAQGAIGINALKVQWDGFSGCSKHLEILDPASGCGSIDSNFFYGGIDHETANVSPLGLAKNRFMVADSWYNQFNDITPPNGSGTFNFTNTWFVPVLVSFNTGPNDAIYFARLTSPINPSQTPSVATLGGNASVSAEVPPGYSLSIGYANAGQLGIFYIGK